MPAEETSKRQTEGERLLAAAAAGDLQTLTALLDDGADVTYQDPADGMSALMKAADSGHVEAVTMLLQAGCPWNLQDHEGYTAGEYGMHCPPVLDLLLAWGVQAELVLGDVARQPAAGSGAHSQQQQEGGQGGKGQDEETGVAAAAEARASGEAGASGSSSTGTKEYLKQRLHYSEDGTKLLDEEGEAVMMGWEGPLMVLHAAAICGGGQRGRDVMNVGFGLGLVDEAIQVHSPRTHIIIEAHPDVHAFALSKGWGTRPGVRLMFGRWQDVLPQLLAEGVQLDGVFWDTYAEFYSDMREFHAALPRLLRPSGVYSFFNGLAPDNIFFHMVYSRLVQEELQKLGFTTRYTPVKIEEALEASVWQGVKNKYWHFPTYYLPESTFMSANTEG